jgi:hypothetical protein
MNQPNHSELQRLIPTHTVEAIQQKYSDASTGSDEWDVLAAAMWHFLAVYGITHSAGQHQRMIKMVLHQVHNEGLAGNHDATTSHHTGDENSTGTNRYYYAAVGEPAVQSREIRHYSVDETVEVTPVASCDHQHPTPEDALACLPELLTSVSGHTAVALIMEVDETGHRRVPMTASMKAAVRNLMQSGAHRENE